MTSCPSIENDHPEIPFVAQRVKTRLVSMKVQVRSLALLSVLRILHCHELWRRLQIWLGFDVAVGCDIARCRL